MMRFLLGVAIGGAVTYWYLTGQIPWEHEISGWFSRAASSYTAEERRSEADRVIDGRAATPR